MRVTREAVVEGALLRLRPMLTSRVIDPRDSAGMAKRDVRGIGEECCWPQGSRGPIKESTLQAIGSLQSDGIRIVILGENKVTAEAIAGQLHLDDVRQWNLLLIT